MSKQNRFELNISRWTRDYKKREKKTLTSDILSELMTELKELKYNSDLANHTAWEIDNIIDNMEGK